MCRIYAEKMRLRSPTVIGCAAALGGTQKNPVAIPHNLLMVEKQREVEVNEHNPHQDRSSSAGMLPQ